MGFLRAIEPDKSSPLVTSEHTTYEEWLNELKILIEENEENLKCKDAVTYEINQLKEIIDCQTKDFEQENCFR